MGRTVCLAETDGSDFAWKYYERKSQDVQVPSQGGPLTRARILQDRDPGNAVASALFDTIYSSGILEPNWFLCDPDCDSKDILIALCAICHADIISEMQTCPSSTPTGWKG
jgi:hypothetical protein